MELNNSPVLTTRNYGINNAKVDDSVFCSQISPFKNVKIENARSFLKKKAKKVDFLNRIGGNFDEQLAKDNNMVLNFEIDKSQEKPLVLNFEFDKTNRTLVEQVEICVKENVEAKVVFFLSGDAQAYHNGLVKFDCGKGSKVDVLYVTNFESEAVNVLRFENNAQESAELNFSLIALANGNSIVNYYSKLSGDACRSKLNSIYIAGGKSFVDLNFVQDVFGKVCEADIQTVGALFGQARKHFKGTINFERGCKKSCGCEDELCLLLSKNAKSKALPMLLCTEEDVDGKHSSSVGKVSERELFYIMSRGFSRSEALKLVVKAKFNVVLEKVFDEEMKQKLIEIVDRKLSYEE